MELDERSAPNINFVPCVTWVRRGVAKPVPERVKLTSEELAAVIQQTKHDLADLEQDSDEDKDNTAKDEVKGHSDKKDKTEEEIVDEYGLADYDEEEEAPEGGAKLLGSAANQCCNEYSDSDLDSNLFLRIPNIRIQIRDFCKTNNIWIRIRNRILSSESESF